MKIHISLLSRMGLVVVVFAALVVSYRLGAASRPASKKVYSNFYPTASSAGTSSPNEFFQGCLRNAKNYGGPGEDLYFLRGLANAGYHKDFEIVWCDDNFVSWKESFSEYHADEGRPIEYWSYGTFSCQTKQDLVLGKIFPEGRVRDELLKRVNDKVRREFDDSDSEIVKFSDLGEFWLEGDGWHFCLESWEIKDYLGTPSELAGEIFVVEHIDGEVLPTKEETSQETPAAAAPTANSPTGH